MLITSPGSKDINLLAWLTTVEAATAPKPFIVIWQNRAGNHACPIVLKDAEFLLSYFE